MSFDPNLLITYAPLMLSGLWATVWITTTATLIALALGLVLSLFNMFGPKLLRGLTRAYIEIMRGLPVLIVLFILYYGGPSIGISLSATAAGIVGIGFYGAAYFAEVFRGGLQSIPPSQIEAAQMLGLLKAQILGRIRIPQMLELILPPGVNLVILLIKESALLSIITVAELTKNATQMANETYAVLEPYLAVALLYWLIIEVVSRAGQRLERKVKRG